MQVGRNPISQVNRVRVRTLLTLVQDIIKPYLDENELAVRGDLHHSHHPVHAFRISEGDKTLQHGAFFSGSSNPAHPERFS
eukprot:1185137-Prorocentrum_minimum.AAC.7